MNSSLKISGWVKITDAQTQQVLVDRANSIHYENFSEALARAICAGPLNAGDENSATGFIRSLALGNGGTNVSSTGVILYKTPNYVGAQATLYNQTYSKTVNANFADNSNPTANRLTVSHQLGKAYTDIAISCLLDYGEPADQLPFDNATAVNDAYVFDELGLRSVGGKLLTHVIFHPVQKSLNRQIQIDYTVRIQTLSNLTTV